MLSLKKLCARYNVKGRQAEDKYLQLKHGTTTKGKNEEEDHAYQTTCLHIKLDISNFSLEVCRVCCYAVIEGRKEG